MTARGEVIARTVLSILTVLVAAAALALGASIGIRPHTATWIIAGVAALLGIGALAAASLAQSAPSQILSTSNTMLVRMIGDKWIDQDDDPQRVVAKRHVEAIIALRKANERRACQAKRALQFQLGFVVVLIAAVATEVVLQILQH
ncbi:hypothetical protein [Gordonia sp. NPDC003376]